MNNMWLKCVLMNSGSSMLFLLDPDSTLRVIDSLALPKLEPAAITSGSEGVPAIIFLICFPELFECQVPAAGSAHLVVVQHHRSMLSRWTARSLLLSLDGLEVDSLSGSYCIARPRLVLDFGRTVFLSLADARLTKREWIRHYSRP